MTQSSPLSAVLSRTVIAVIAVWSLGCNAGERPADAAAPEAAAKIPAPVTIDGESEPAEEDEAAGEGVARDHRVSVSVTPRIACSRIDLALSAHRHLAAPEEAIPVVLEEVAAGETRTETVAASLADGHDWGLLLVKATLHPVAAEGEPAPDPIATAITIVVGDLPEPDAEPAQAPGEEVPDRRLPARVREQD